MLQQKRMDALWRLAGDTALGDQQLVHAALGLGAALLVPGQAFGARLGRVCGAVIEIEAANDERLGGATAAPKSIRVDAPHREAIARLVTCRWDDIANGALVVTPFNAANALYVLSFASALPAQRPLQADDEAFTESIARLIAARMQNKWNAVRARDPLEVVTLTDSARRSPAS